ncbi:MAG TPA: arylamine N-acetyltransferase [Phototrophicaceae bacterium]|nr:arylamine N-acetyltransferase [Phototrophicaceae bacterium]
MTQLDAYLQRIGDGGSLAPTFETLARLHRQHLLTIPYENFDIHRGQTLSLDPQKTFDKIVTGQRGGWCYEMNGLFARMLREIGFDVTLLASGVTDQFEGDGSIGEHLILLVKIDGQPYLADVGFGNGLIEPIPLEAGEYQQGYLKFPLLRDGGRWFFPNHQYGGAGFVFTLQPRTMDYFAERCHWLQTEPTSRFVQKTISFRFTPEGYHMLYGAVLTTVTAQGKSERLVENRTSYEQVLNDLLDLHLPDTAAIWEKVWARHQAWVAAGKP